MFENTGDSTLDLTGWTVSDAAGHSYTFRGVTLASSGTVTLYTGSGQDTSSKVYWGSVSAIWNNSGDTIVVTTASGRTVIKRSY